jgi:hypothetical protein
MNPVSFDHGILVADSSSTIYGFFNIHDEINIFFEIHVTQV